MKLMVGDKILLRQTTFKGKHKIQDHWENTIYEVMEQPFEKIPVFKIKSRGGDDGVKIVHRNLLLPLFSDPSDLTGEPIIAGVRLVQKKPWVPRWQLQWVQLPVMCII